MSNITKLRLPSPAKLNLFLHICGRRKDGYHDIQTVFHFVDFCDWLTFDTNTSGRIIIQGMSMAHEDNLITKAAQVLQPQASNNAGVTITVEKNLPMGAGLGGGSSNAATTLLALNRLWGVHLSQQELLESARALGADVPAFVFGHTAWGEGIGEELTRLEVKEKWYLLVLPECHIDTAKIFSHSLLTRDNKKKRIAAFLDQAWQNDFNNDFEPLVRMLHPDIDNILDQLSHYGQARMTGTGSCVFLAFDEISQAEEVALRWQPDYKTMIAKGSNKSPTVSAMELHKLR